MLLIYTHQITNRVKYTFHVIFRHVLKIDIEFTNDKKYFTSFNGPKLSYSNAPLSDELHFKCEELLFENKFSAFPDWQEGADKPDDIFAFSFFLVTRYEEYLPFTEDVYHRFSAKGSISYALGILDKPLVNIWSLEVKEMLLQRYPTLQFPQTKYNYVPTVDIDNAYAYLGKSLARTLGGYARALLKGDTDDLKKRKNVLSGKEKDPYDTYEFQFELHKKYSLKPIYFFLLGDWAPNDKNLPHSNPLMQELIKKISSKTETGIHPSFASNEVSTKVEVEEKRLREITGRKTTKSRQHFLKLRFPDTYRNLIAAGIKDDYTMGYADEVGFRAGICSPYNWYDLQKEEETSLTIHPFAVMDGTLNSYLKLTPAEALEKVKSLVQEVKNVNGELITIWHNETLSDWKDWKGWKELYKQVIEIAV